MEWISVKDELPKDRVGKLVYCGTDKSITRMYYDPNNKYWVDTMGFERMDVTHWMPLPEPPKMKKRRQNTTLRGL